MSGDRVLPAVLAGKCLLPGCRMCVAGARHTSFECGAHPACRTGSDVAVRAPVSAKVRGARALWLLLIVDRGSGNLSRRLQNASKNRVDSKEVVRT